MALPCDRLLPAKDVAAYFGITTNALYVQRHHGQAPGALAIRVGRGLRWNPETINEWVTEAETSPGDE